MPEKFGFREPLVRIHIFWGHELDKETYCGVNTFRLLPLIRCRSQQWDPGFSLPGHFLQPKKKPSFKANAYRTTGFQLVLRLLHTRHVWEMDYLWVFSSVKHCPIKTQQKHISWFAIKIPLHLQKLSYNKQCVQSVIPEFELRHLEPGIYFTVESESKLSLFSIY